jgi:hypothetical protein
VTGAAVAGRRASGPAGRERLRAATAAVALAAALLAGCESAGPSVLEVGDCIADAPAFVGDSPDVRSIPCEQPHGGEVYFVEDYSSGGEYPGDPAFQDFVSERCIPAFEAYTGRDFMTENELDLGWLQPSEEDWTAGGRRIVCFASPTEQGKKTTGSIRRP